MMTATEARRRADLGMHNLLYIEIVGDYITRVYERNREVKSRFLSARGKFCWLFLYEETKLYVMIEVYISASKREFQ